MRKANKREIRDYEKKHITDLLLIDEDGEVRELTYEDLAKFRPLREVMPLEFMEMVLKHQAEMEEKGLMPRKLTRGKQVAPLKESIMIRLSSEVLEKFRATGKGWQTRINDVLVQYAKNM